MKIQERLRIIGRAIRGEVTEKVVKVKNEKGTYTTTVDLFKTGASLSSYKSVSSKLIEANQGWVYRNNDVIAREVGTIEFELFTTRRVGDQIEFVPIPQHPLLDALDKFNEFTSASSGFYLTESHINLAGDSFWYVDGKGPNIKGIYLLQPDKVTLELGDPSYGQYIIKSYKYQDTIDGKQVEEKYDKEDIVHFKSPNPANPYRGKSKVEATCEEIDTDNLITLANKRMYQHGLITNFILATEKMLTQEQVAAIESKLQGNYAGANNAYKTMILSGGLKPESIQMTNKDMETIGQMGWFRDKIMIIFGNTPASIGIVEDVNRANAEATLLDWKRTTVKSEMKKIADTINEFLLPRFGEGLILGFKDPVPEDRGTRIDEAVTLKSASIITTNEARQMVDLDPSDEEGADELSRPMPSFGPLEDEPDEEAIPKSVRNVSYMKYLRQSGIIKEVRTYLKTKEVAEPIAKRMVKQRAKRNKKEVETPLSDSFTNEQIFDFHAKQIALVEAHEPIFRNKVEQFIKKLVERALEKVPEEVADMQQKALFDEEDEVARAIVDFRPILMEVGLMSAQRALHLAGDDSIYMPDKLRKRVSRSVEKFAKSMVHTDKEKIIDMIAKGVAEGQSVPAIRAGIQENFESYSKMQAERITRTEVIRASNQGTVDAWTQSEVVSGKEWLTAEDERVDDDCEEMNGVIVDVESSFNDSIRDRFDSDVAEKLLDYGSVGEPPLHPDCRCTLIPVLIDSKSFNSKDYAREREVSNKIKELEDQIDKRTKEYREIKKQNLKQEIYIKELERLAEKPEIDTEEI